MAKEKQGPALPQSGGAWKEDPLTGELVRADTRDELRMTNEKSEAAPAAVDKELK